MMYSYLYTKSCCISHTVACINEIDCYQLCIAHRYVLSVICSCVLIYLKYNITDIHEYC